MRLRSAMGISEIGFVIPLVLLTGCSGAVGAGGEKVGAAASALNDESSDLPADSLPNDFPFANPSGFAATSSTTGRVDLTGPFFQQLGTNGRTCATCHQASDGWTVIPPNIQARFDETGGTDPIFRPVDGSNSPNADVSTVEARRAAYSMLLTKGLIRIGIGIPETAEFTLLAVDDPYGFASATELSLFRRPLPATNLRFLTTVMWDGRETLAGTDHCNQEYEGGKCFAPLTADLAHQSNDATQGHAQAPNPIDEATRDAIVAFETTLFTAQVFDNRAYLLRARRARGGPEPLATDVTYYGINDNLGDYQTGAPFSPFVFSEYQPWADIGHHHDQGEDADEDQDDSVNAARQAVARGEALFNSRPITISGVAGLNFDGPFSPPLPESFTGACTTCHDEPHAGNHSIVAPLNIGLADASRRTADLPLYTLQNKGTGATVQTTDPGRALISGKWADIGKFKGPILRGLAARAPYFHNGSAKDLDAVVDFYNERFAMGLSDQEHEDLVAFLRAL
jgi:cytochrome c peroxidase